jgi:hypothetical protein
MTSDVRGATMTKSSAAVFRFERTRLRPERRSARPTCVTLRAASLGRRRSIRRRTHHDSALVLRTLMILGAPVVNFTFWMGGHPDWRQEFWTSGGKLWQGHEDPAEPRVPGLPSRWRRRLRGRARQLVALRRRCTPRCTPRTRQSVRPPPRRRPACRGIPNRAWPGRSRWR